MSLVLVYFAAIESTTCKR